MPTIRTCLPFKVPTLKICSLNGVPKMLYKAISHTVQLKCLNPILLQNYPGQFSQLIGSVTGMNIASQEDLSQLVESIYQQVPSPLGLFYTKTILINFLAFFRFLRHFLITTLFIKTENAKN